MFWKTWTVIWIGRRGLGEAFLAQQGDVMDAVQRLRHQAETAGTLKSSPQETVASDGGDVTISSPPSDVIYVPDYDPWCAYGPWPYPIYGPYYYAPWNGYCGPDDFSCRLGRGSIPSIRLLGMGRFRLAQPSHPDRSRPATIGIIPVTSRQVMSGSTIRPIAPECLWQPRNVQQFRPAQESPPSFRGYEGRDRRHVRFVAVERAGLRELRLGTGNENAIGARTEQPRAGCSAEAASAAAMGAVPGDIDDRPNIRSSSTGNIVPWTRLFQLP